MRRSPGAALSALIVGLSAVGLPGLAQPGAGFALGVLRHDGVLVPFAAFDGDGFHRPWPGPDRRAEVPLTLDAVPASWWPDGQPTPAWRVQPLGQPMRALTVEGPTWVPVHCQQQVALLTDYRPDRPPPPPDVQPYPKDGLAWTGDAAIGPIEIVPPASPGWQALADTLAGELAPVVNERESEAIDGASRSRQLLRLAWGHPVSADERAGRTAEIEAVYEAPAGADDARLYYVEASKRYQRSGSDRDADCDIVTFVTAWIHMDAEGGVTPRQMEAHVTACDYHSVDLMHPLGLLTLKGDPLWVVQWSTWGRESYAVIDPSSEAIETVFDAPAGTCSG